MDNSTQRKTLLRRLWPMEDIEEAAWKLKFLGRMTGFLVCEKKICKITVLHIALALALDCNSALESGFYRSMPRKVDPERVVRQFVAFFPF